MPTAPAKVNKEMNAAAEAALHALRYLGADHFITIHPDYSVSAPVSTAYRIVDFIKGNCLT